MDCKGAKADPNKRLQLVASAHTPNQVLSFDRDVHLRYQPEKRSLFGLSWSAWLFAAW